MEQTEIILKVDMEDLKDIYFGSREHVYFFGPKTKEISIALVCAAIFFPLMLVDAISTKKAGIGFFIATIGLFATVAGFWSAAGPIIKWKKSINTFLAKAEKVKNLRVIYNDEFIHHFQDDMETKLNWSAVERATITDRYLELHASTYIFLPKSAMTGQEYQVLSDKIMEKVPQVEKF